MCVYNVKIVSFLLLSLLLLLLKRTKGRRKRKIDFLSASNPFFKSLRRVIILFYFSLFFTSFSFKMHNNILSIDTWCFTHTRTIQRNCPLTITSSLCLSVFTNRSRSFVFFSFLIKDVHNQCNGIHRFFSKNFTQKWWSLNVAVFFALTNKSNTL